MAAAGAVVPEEGVCREAAGAVDIVDEVEVEVAVAVVVAPGGGRAGGLVPEAGPFRDVGEAPTSIVVEEDVAAVTEHVEVGPAVVVVVGEDGPAANVFGQTHRRRQGGDGEGAVAVVAVEGVGAELVGDVEVDPAIPVVVAPGLAGHDVPVAEDPIVRRKPRVRGGNAGGRADIGEGGEASMVDRRARRGIGRRLGGVGDRVARVGALGTGCRLRCCDGGLGSRIGA